MKYYSYRTVEDTVTINDAGRESMRYLITYRDLINGMDKILAIIYSDKKLNFELEESDEIENNMVQPDNGSTGSGERSGRDSNTAGIYSSIDQFRQYNHKSLSAQTRKGVK